MYARIAAFENPDVSLVDDLVSTVRGRVRAGSELPKATRFLMLLDREHGRSLGVTFFESEEAIHEAEPVFEKMGDEIPESKRGKRTSVDVYEVVLAEGGEGARAARVSSLAGPPDKFEEGIRYAKETIFPSARELPGFAGVVFLVDRKTGRAKTITLWDSEESLQASEEAANKLRARAAEAGGETITGVDRYEVAISEVRVAVPA
jgi:heme-degrading monooxygenase HmoA